MNHFFTACLSILMASATTSASSQVSITTDGTPAHPSAMLHIKSTDKGFLMPQVTSAQRNAIVSPANGLMVFDTNVGSPFVFRQSSGWIEVTTSTSSEAWSLLGNSGIDPNNQFIGTLDNVRIAFRVNNQPYGLLGRSDVFLGLNSARFKVPSTSGGDNIGLGTNTNESGIGIRNISIGYFAGSQTTALQRENIAIGNNAMSESTEGSYNIAIGSNTLREANSSSAVYNIGIGDNALRKISSGSSNIGIGREAISRITTATANTAVGDSALSNLITGNRNTVFGSKAALTGTNLEEVVAIGYESMRQSSASQSTAVGYQTLTKASGIGNTAIGYRTLQNLTSGTYNTAMGSNVLTNNTIGNNQVAIGRTVYPTLLGGSNNIGIGINVFDAMFSGNTTIGIGRLVGSNHLSADSSIMIGTDLSRTSTNNPRKVILIGQRMMETTNHSLQSSIGIGGQSFNAVLTGEDNINIGYDNLNTPTSLSQVTVVGTGNSSTVSALTNTIILGNNITASASNTVYLGNTSTLRWQLGRDANTAGFALQVGTTSSNGNGAGLTTGGAWTNACDSTLKTDIQFVNTKDLLSQLMQLPISKWRYTGTNEYHIGPMAQDFHRLFGVGVNDRSISTVDPAGIALAAAQQLHQQNQALEQQIEQLEQRLKQLD